MHFDLAEGPAAGEYRLAPDGTDYATFAAARQVAGGEPRVAPRRSSPPRLDSGTAAPVPGFALTTGIIRTADGTLSLPPTPALDAATTALYRPRPSGKPQRIAALPANGLPNGLAYDEPAKTLYPDRLRSSARSPPCR